MVRLLTGSSRLPAMVPLLVLLSTFVACPRHGRSQSVDLVLRDLSVIRSSSIRFDQAGVFLADGTRYDWDQVLTANLDHDRQSQFQQFVQQIGLPLFRIRRRLNDRDWDALSEVVEPVFAGQINQPITPSNLRTRYLVNLAAFYSRLQQENRPAALEPFLQACRMRGHPDWNLAEVPDDINLTAKEVENLFTTRLLPIWFQKSEARDVLACLESTEPAEAASPGVLIYRAAALIGTGQVAQAEQLLSEMAAIRDDTVADWLPLLQVQLEIRQGMTGPATTALRSSYREFTGPRRAVSSYLLARQMSKIQDDYDAAVLELLQIPAIHGENLKSLSAAALYHAALLADEAGRSDEAAIFRSELSNHFQKTYHAKLVADR